MRRRTPTTDQEHTKPRYKEGLAKLKKNPGLEPAKWNEDTKARMVKLARSGLSDKQIAEALPVHIDTFKRWLKSPAVRAALKEARDTTGRGYWKTYLVGRLSPAARRCWDEIHGADDQDRLALAERLLAKNGVRVKQELFLAALTHFNFKLGVACEFVGIRRADVDYWRQADPDFAELLGEVAEAKKDLFEGAFIDLVVDRNPAAVLFAARALLGDRGYNPKKLIETTSTVTHTGTVSVKQLDNLTEEQKRTLLNALREGRGAPRLAEAQVVRTVVPEPNAVNKPAVEE